jgi:hypothetical protein
MNQREKAAWEMHNFFSELKTQYVIIGGLAVQHWGEPRFTQDVDLTVAAPLTDFTSFIQMIVARFTSRLEDPITFARHNRVVLVRASNGCPVDISLALPGYEDEVMSRAVDYNLESDKAVRLCSAEDLIIHKAVAGRPQDVRDIEGIVYRQQDTLDVNYIRQWLHAFADILAKPDLLELFEKPWRKIQAR